MTVTKLDEKYCSDAQALCDFKDMIRKHTLSYEDRLSDESIPFWCKILSAISDNYVKELVYEVLSEYIYYYERDCFEDFDEVYNAYKDERLFIFPFKPGDFISTPYGNPEKVISITMHGASNYPIVNTEKRYVEKHVVVKNNEIQYEDIEEYRKVDKANELGLYNKYGELDDYYYE